MMSKSAYLTDEGGHNGLTYGPHLMFHTPVKDGKDWGAGVAGSPLVSGPHWFFSPKEQSELGSAMLRAQMKRLPPILFAVVVTNWSDRTPAGKHNA